MSGKLSDSPWFWLLTFSVAAVAALVAVGPKHIRRQERLVRMQSVRDQLHTAPEPDALQPLPDRSTPIVGKQPHVSLQPLTIFFVAALAVAVVLFVAVRIVIKARAPTASADSSAPADQGAG
jgi:hypothetical protein